MPTVKRPMGRSVNNTVTANRRGAKGIGQSRRTLATSVYHRNGNDTAYSWNNNPNGIKKK